MYTDDENKLLIKQVVQAVVAEEDSAYINEFISEINQEGNHDAEKIGVFCDRYELGEWFHSAMLINSIDIIEELQGIFWRKFHDEVEAREEEVLIRASLQRENA